MILLDTNVVSETMRGQNADAAVVVWLKAQRQADLFISTITVMELLNGVAMLPTGKRKTFIDNQVQLAIQDYQGRIVDFDMMAAVAHPRVMQTARWRGFAIGSGDGMIGAIAAANGFSVCTRDVTPFRGMGLHVSNPWSDPAS
jgi:predicted nucleic acid-binding protein